MYLSPTHFLFPPPLLCRQLLCSPDLSSVVRCLFYLPKQNKFSPFYPTSYQIESFVFTCCLVSFQEFFYVLGPVETPGFSGLHPAPAQGQGFPPFPSLYCLASCGAAVPGHTTRTVPPGTDPSCGHGRHQALDTPHHCRRCLGPEEDETGRRGQWISFPLWLSALVWQRQATLIRRGGLMHGSSTVSSGRPQSTF